VAFNGRAAGANMALEDGLCLALLLEQLASKGGSLDETLQRCV
jgi:2-polyprenyl-6-methoxyphenol hydroxylase-like FAD-dependent oxidoreductase